MDLEDEVIGLLSEKSRTMAEMAHELGMNYYTLRKYLKPIIDEGRIIPVNRQKRNVRYTIGTDNSPNIIIPKVSFKAEQYKITSFTDHENGILQLSETTAIDLLRSIVNLFDVVEGIHEGRSLQQTEQYLNRIRARLNQVLTNYEQLALLANQILNNEKFWNPIYLEKFVNDESYEKKKQQIETTQEYLNNC